MSIRTFTYAICLTLAGCAGAPSDLPEAGGPKGGKADGLFEDGPMYLTAAFDGSRALRMWVDTLAFARSLERETRHALRFTYFINTAYYDPTVTGSWIGTAATWNEGRVRWAMTQQAANEGHEIANHTVRHQDGSTWTYDHWKAELDEFEALAHEHLFEPIYGSDGRPLFPRWQAAPGARPGAIGAACTTATQCDGRSCAMVTPEQGFCTTTCTSDSQCGAGMACGGICLPLPAYPVYDEDGAVLFDDEGRPNLNHPSLRPYAMRGFRAPQLGINRAMYQAINDLGYVYDTSDIFEPGPPTRARQAGQTFSGIFEFGLMRHPGAHAAPMDYNYLANDVSPEQMLADYKMSIVRQYEQVRRAPWNIGHHFSLWKDGGYWQTMQAALRYAATGCVENGVKRCAEMEFVTFAGLADRLNGKGDGVDPFEPSGEALSDDHAAEMCDEDL